MSSAAAISLAPAKQGAALIDSRSPLHVVIGFAAGVMGVDPHLAVLTFIGARIVEQALQSGTKHALFEREDGQSLGNEMTDLLLEMAGLHAGEVLRERLLAEHEAPTAGLGRIVTNPYTGALQVIP